MISRLPISTNLKISVICLVHLMFLHKQISTSKLFYIYWNTSSSIFRIDKTDYIIDVNKGNNKYEYDQVNILCPKYSRETNEGETETFMIYSVSREEFETCRIKNANPKVIAVCNKPYDVLYFTITFRPFSPQPNALEFLPGQNYYFISTSSRDDLHLRIGGRCSTNNMKVMFKVCCSSTDNLTASMTTNRRLVAAAAGATTKSSRLNFGTDDVPSLDLYPPIYPPVNRRGSMTTATTATTTTMTKSMLTTTTTEAAATIVTTAQSSSSHTKHFKDKIEKKTATQKEKKMNEVLQNGLSQNKKDLASSSSSLKIAPKWPFSLPSSLLLLLSLLWTLLLSSSAVHHLDNED